MVTVINIVEVASVQEAGTNAQEAIKDLVWEAVEALMGNRESTRNALLAQIEGLMSGEGTYLAPGIDLVGKLCDEVNDERTLSIETSIVLTLGVVAARAAGATSNKELLVGALTAAGITDVQVCDCRAVPLAHVDEFAALHAPDLRMSEFDAALPDGRAAGFVSGLWNHLSPMQRYAWYTSGLNRLREESQPA